MYYFISKHLFDYPFEYFLEVRRTSTSCVRRLRKDKDRPFSSMSPNRVCIFSQDVKFNITSLLRLHVRNVTWSHLFLFYFLTTSLYIENIGSPSRLPRFLLYPRTTPVSGMTTKRSQVLTIFHVDEDKGYQCLCRSCFTYVISTDPTFFSWGIGCVSGKRESNLFVTEIKDLDIYTTSNFDELNVPTPSLQSPLLVQV